MSGCQVSRYVIRRLAEDEVERVAAVLALARLHQNNGYYLVAWEANDPVGHAHLAVTDPPELQDVLVLPSYRRRRIATSLTLAVEEEARILGFDRIRLQVSRMTTGPKRSTTTAGISTPAYLHNA